ncbi:hypothetical protein KI387_023129, partial [Taxus chinensis]
MASSFYLAPVNELIARVLISISETTAAIKDVTLEQESFREFSRYIATLKPILEDLRARRVSINSEALKWLWNPYILRYRKLISSSKVSDLEDSLSRKNSHDIGHQVQEHPLKPFTCPLSKEIMEDPVDLVSGHNFERKVILEYFDKGNRICPVSVKLLAEDEQVDYAVSLLLDLSQNSAFSERIG